MEDIYFLHSTPNIFIVYQYLVITVTFIAKYLVINKIWLRKHEPEVADSVSIVAVILEIVLILPILALSIINFSLDTFVLEAVVISSHLVLFFIGVGLWVNNGLNFTDKFARTFNIERKEYKSLVKEAFHTKDMNKIFSFICMFAILDREIQPQEEKLLKKFAEEYNLNYQLTMSDIQNMYGSKLDNSPAVLMKAIRNQVVSFLETSPPKKVIIYLEDIIVHLIDVDRKLTNEEIIVANEIKLILQQYLLKNGNITELYYIVVVPQTIEQEEAFLSVNTKYRQAKSEVAGSTNTFLIDSYYSLEFAEMMRDKYIELFKCFVTVEKLALPK